MANNREIRATISLDDSRFRNSIKTVNSSLKLANQQFQEGQTVLKGYGASSEALAKVQDAAQKKIEALTAKQKAYATAIEKEKTTLAGAKKTRDELNKQLEAQKKKMEDIAETSGKSSKAYDEEAKKLQELANKLIVAERATTKSETAVNKYSAEISKANTAINKTETELKQLAQAFDNADADASQMSQTLQGINIANLADGVRDFSQRVSGAFDAVNAKIIGFGKQVLDAGLNYSTSMAQVQAVSGATATEMEQMNQKAKDLGKSTEYSASQVMDAFGYMSLAGYDVNRSLGEVEKMLKLSTVGSMDLATASDLATDSMSASGVQASDVSKYFDILATAQANSNTTVNQLMESFIGAGGTLQAMNTPLEVSASLIGALANAGIKGSEAGSALNSILANLTDATSTTSKGFEAMGIEVFDAEGKFLGFETVLEKTANFLSTATDEQSKFIAVSLGGKTQMDTFNALINAMADGSYTKLKTSIENSSGALSEQYAILKDTPANKIAELESKFEALCLVLFEKLLPVFEDGIEWLGDLIDTFAEMDDGTINLGINIAKFSLIAGTAFKVFGTVVSVVASATQALSFFTAGTATATAGATAVAGGVAATGGAFAGIGTALASVATFLTGPFGLAIAAVVAGVVGGATVIKKANEKVIKETDLMADGVVKSTRETVDAFGEISVATESEAVTISQNTKDILGTILERNSEQTRLLTEATTRRRAITEEELIELNSIEAELQGDISDTARTELNARLEALQQKYNDEKTIMATEHTNLTTLAEEQKLATLEALNAKYNEERAILMQFYMDTEGIDAEEAAKRVGFMDANHSATVESLNSNYAEYLELLNKSYQDENGLTASENLKLMQLKEQLASETIGNLSATEQEAALINSRMKDEALYTSAESVGQLIRDAENLKTSRIKEASDLCDEEIRILTQQHSQSEGLSDEAYSAAVSAAETKRDEAIKVAEDEKEGTLEQIGEMNQELLNSVDHTTGESLTAWQKFLGDMGRKINGNKAELDSWKAKVDEIPASQTKKIEIVTEYKTIGTPEGSGTGSGSKMRALTLSDTRATFDANGANLRRMAEQFERIAGATLQKMKEIGEGVQVINENNIYIDNKKGMRTVSKRLEDERNALAISKGSQRLDIGGKKYV